MADIKRITHQPCDFPIVFKSLLSGREAVSPSIVMQVSRGALSGTALAPGQRTAWGACAIVLVHHVPTLVTLDCTAPLEFTVTAAGGFHSPLFHLQATVRAQAPAAVSFPPGCVVAVLQTLPTLGAIDAQAGIAGTVIW